MNENQNDERPQGPDETTDETQQADETQQVEVTAEPDETQVLPAAETTPETQVLESTETGDTQTLPASVDEVEPDAEATQVVEPTPAGPDDPLSIFDQPAPATSVQESAGSTYPDVASGPAYTGPAYSGPSYPGAYSAPYGTAPAQQGSAYQAPPSYQTPPSSYAAPGYVPTWEAPAKPLVKTTPRTSTIVWGFIILAIGVGAISVAAGATLDIGLAMIWLLAAAGAVLVVASIVGAARRRSRTEHSAGA